MKYVKHISQIASACLLLLIVGCATKQAGNQLEEQSNVKPEPKKVVETKKVAVPNLLNTEQYLPDQTPQFDEAGVEIPYQVATNPYETLKGQIRKESVFKYIEARRAFKAKNFELAEKVLAELIEEDSVLSGPWVMRGDIALEKDDLDNAIKHYNSAIKTNEKNINAYLRLAKVQRIKGEFLKAEQTYAKALSLWKDFPEAHLNLAILYDIYLNKPLKAVQHMEAYQFLTKGRNKQVAGWLTEIRSRTDSATNVSAEESLISSDPAS